MYLSHTRGIFYLLLFNNSCPFHWSHWFRLELKLFKDFESTTTLTTIKIKNKRPKRQVLFIKH